MRRTSICLNRPIIVGYSILELSKFLIYEYHHNVFKPVYDEKLNLLYVDTDGFIYEIYTKNILTRRSKYNPTCWMYEFNIIILI